MSKLVIDGGKKVNSKAFPMWPSFEASTIERAMEPLKSGKVNYWTGAVGTQFEEAWAKWNGVKYAITRRSTITAPPSISATMRWIAGRPFSTRRKISTSVTTPEGIY